MAGAAHQRRVLIAGRGFIGRHLYAQLQHPERRIVIADKEDLVEAHEALDPEVIVWAAGTRVDDPEVCHDEHVRAPLAAFETAASLRRFVYLSSGEVYGVQDTPFAESLPLKGQHPYAKAKIAGEQALSEQAQRRRIALDILRLPVVYGPRQQGSMLVPSLVETLLRGERFAMTGGEQTRDFLYVDDACGLVEYCLAGDAPAGTFNASGGRELSIRDAARTIARAISSEATALLDIGALPYREDEQMRYALDASRAREIFGWAPRVDFETGAGWVVEAARRDPVP